MEGPIIEVKDLCYKVGKKYLLKDISWKVERGEHWNVFGLNGSGKTTLLSILAGYKMPTTGSVKIFGEPYSNENLLAFRKKIGLVSTSCFDLFFSNESVLQIVLSGTLGSTGLDFSISNQDVKNARGMLEKVGLAQKLDQSYDLLSKGERENVLIARALVANPEILILDEPCSGLDVSARDKMLNTIEALAGRQDMTMVYVTHYAEEILDCFEHTLLLKQGKIYQQGATRILFTEENISDFLGTDVEVQCDQYGRMSMHARKRYVIEL